jgi:hypothetical protein
MSAGKKRTRQVRQSLNDFELLDGALFIRRDE